MPATSGYLSPLLPVTTLLLCSRTLDLLALIQENTSSWRPELKCSTMTTLRSSVNQATPKCWRMANGSAQGPATNRCCGLLSEPLEPVCQTAGRHGEERPWQTSAGRRPPLTLKLTIVLLFPSQPLRRRPDLFPPPGLRRVHLDAPTRSDLQNAICF